MKIIAIILFIAMYAVMIIKSDWRVYAALTVAAIFILLGIQPISGVPGAIDWNVLMMICGTMIVVDYFIDSKMPNLWQPS